MDPKTPFTFTYLDQVAEEMLLPYNLNTLKGRTRKGRD